LQNQTSLPNQIIVVDDFSEDNIEEILKKHKVILVKRKINGGVAATRNSGLELVSSDIVVFIDGDAIPDLFMVEAIKNVYLEFGDQIVGVGGRAIECKLRSIYDRWRSIHLSQDYGLKQVIGIPFLFGVCCSYRTDFLKAINGFDEFYTRNAGEDYDLGLRINKLGYKLVYSPEIIVNHQHIDTFESLKNSQYKWAFWGYISNTRNNRSRILTWLGLIKDLINYILLDLIFRRDLSLFKIGLAAIRYKFHGFQNASKYYAKIN
jgi:cellulose synthase/poly-beta-1,6-N-acetylglucosamine synthase-like glycosyltransferase